MMAFTQCVRMVPRAGRRLVAASCQPARSFFSPWPRPTDIGALIRDMDRQMDRLERQVFRGLPGLPRLATRPIDHTVEARDGQYRLAVDLAGFKPEEVGLALDESGRRLTITAKCEREHADGSRFAQQLSRTVTLPESIDVAQMSSVLHQDGVLAIEAPFKEQPPSQMQQQEPRRIPISRTGASGELEQGKEEKAAEAPSSTSSSN